MQMQADVRNGYILNTPPLFYKKREYCKKKFVSLKNKS